MINKNGSLCDYDVLANFANGRDLFEMKRRLILFLLAGVFCFAEEVTLTKSAVMKAERSIVSLKPGTVVELLSRDNKTLTVRYGKITGTIPAGSIGAGPSDAAAAVKKEDPVSAPVPPRKAETNYGKAVEKAKENAAKHEKNVVKPTDEILP